LIKQNPENTKNFSYSFLDMLMQQRLAIFYANSLQIFLFRQDHKTKAKIPKNWIEYCQYLWQESAGNRSSVLFALFKLGPTAYLFKFPLEECTTGFFQGRNISSDWLPV